MTDERLDEGCRSCDQLIEERDAAEEAVSQIYFLILGRSPEWSNLFGHEQAIAEIKDAFDLVRSAAKESRRNHHADIRQQTDPIRAALNTRHAESCLLSTAGGLCNCGVHYTLAAYDRLIASYQKCVEALNVAKNPERDMYDQYGAWHGRLAEQIDAALASVPVEYRNRNS